MDQSKREHKQNVEWNDKDNSEYEREFNKRNTKKISKLKMKISVSQIKNSMENLLDHNEKGNKMV